MEKSEVVKITPFTKESSSMFPEKYSAVLSSSLSNSIFSWLNAVFCGVFWPHCTACGILVPRADIEPEPPALEAQSLNHWTAREIP